MWTTICFFALCSLVAWPSPAKAQGAPAWQRGDFWLIMVESATGTAALPDEPGGGVEMWVATARKELFCGAECYRVEFLMLTGPERPAAKRLIIS